MNQQYNNIIIANYSIHSLALIIWAQKNLKDNFCVISVDTKFSSDDWNAYLTKVFHWLDEQSVDYLHLEAENSFLFDVFA